MALQDPKVYLLTGTGKKARVAKWPSGRQEEVAGRAPQETLGSSLDTARKSVLCPVPGLG